MKNKIILIAMFCILTMLILFYAPAMQAAKDGFQIWSTTVMPALFPFFVCSYIITENINFKNKRFLSGTVFLLSAVSGAPSGARLSSMFYGESNLKDYKAAALNLISPMFILGALSYSVLSNVECAIPIAIGHYLGAILTLVFIRLIFKNDTPNQNSFSVLKSEEKTGFLSTLGEGIKRGFTSMLFICGTIVFFMVFLTVLEHAGIVDLIARPLTLIGINETLAHALILGVFEVTNGINELANVSGVSLSITASIACALISFGGICIFMQSRNFLRIHPIKYMLTKLFQAILSGCICYLASIIFNIDGAVFEPISTEKLVNNAISIGAIAVSLLAPLGAVALFAFTRRKR
ncbi:MAG: hypothetical protein RRY79_01880 [Clostridia bacterium]